MKQQERKKWAITGLQPFLKFSYSMKFESAEWVGAQGK